MLGCLCIRFPGWGGQLYYSNVVLAQPYSLNLHFYSNQTIDRNSIHAKALQNSTRSYLLQFSFPLSGCYPLEVLSSSMRRPRYSDSCVSSGNGEFCTDLRHSLLAAYPLSILDSAFPSAFQKGLTVIDDFKVSGPCSSKILSIKGLTKKRRMAIPSAAVQLFRSRLLSTFDNRKLSAILCREGIKAMSERRDISFRLCNGLWNATVTVRPNCWSSLQKSTWILFGVYACVSFAAGSVMPEIFVGSPAYAEPIKDRPEFDDGNSGRGVVEAKSSHGKQIYTDYSVIGIPGDGRCLFRAVAHGAQLRRGKSAPNRSLQREYADDLREKVVDELVQRRKETEWFIEGNFDTYTRRMRQPHVWGGEPELLMASHVLKMPITVYMLDNDAEGLISIAEYGSEYVKEYPVPIRVLYHGFGHYDALQFPSSETYPVKEEL